MSSPIAIIAGVGPGTGASVARKFALTYPVALLARRPENYEPLVKEIEGAGGKAVGIQTDVSKASSIEDLVKTVKTSFGEDVKVAAAVFNVSGPFARKPFLELTEEDVDKGYEGTVKSAFLFSRAILPLLLDPPSSAAHPPTLIFTGATASIKGSARFASFAAPKFALRALSQSLAQEFGPQGVHVSHAIIDGVIDIPRTKEWDLGPGGKIEPGAIADAYWWLHTQPRTAFTWEIDLRPGVEKW